MADDPELERIRRGLRAEMEARARSLTARPVALAAQGFDAFLSQHRIVMVDFWAQWCGPCRTMEPMVEELARDWAGRIAVAKLNVDESPSVAERYRVSGIPAFIFFEEGKVAGRLVGARPKRDFTNVAAELMADGAKEGNESGRKGPDPIRG